MSFDAKPYPHLVREGYRETSPFDRAYNCIAHAAGDDKRWWWPGGGKNSYWPRTAPNKLTVQAFVDAFSTLGYSVCKNGNLEPGFEKIAIYSFKGKAAHAARQLPDGLWSHKLGRDIDLTTTLRGLEDGNHGAYGTVAKYMRRKIK